MSKAKKLTGESAAKKALVRAIRDAVELADAAGIWIFTAVRYTNGEILCFNGSNAPEVLLEKIAAEGWPMAVESVDGEAELEEEE